MGTSDSDDDDYKTVTASCVFCSLIVQEGEGLFCDDCRVHFHYGCRKIPTVKKGAHKLTNAIKECLELACVAVFCDHCIEARKGRPIPSHNTAGNTEATLKGICEEIAIIRVTVDSALGPLMPPSASTGHSIVKGKNKTFAQAAAAKNRAPAPTIVQAVAKAVSDNTAEELRLRSVVVDGVPMVEGESDREKIQSLVDVAGLTNTVRLCDVYRMGKTSPLGRPPKIKVVLGTREMQRCLLDKNIRDIIKGPSCPPGFSNAFLNPSRTWEGRRLLLKLRKRRNDLNATITEAKDQWFLDYRRGVLVGRVGGEPDWKGPGDVGWGVWEAEFEKNNPITNHDSANSDSRRATDNNRRPSRLSQDSLPSKSGN